ncbi:hypothetical protein GCM10022393_06230 [Aquimarina addita]|uniref:Ig-like domain-containing protein n=2 Tax=Aquimarina addita TaxID=870485 RepID=A0ABP7XAM2_9FLAO
MLCAQNRNIGAPDLDNSSNNQICATPETLSTEFVIIATLSPGDAFPSGNQFILQISDPDGSFPDNPETLAIADGPNNGTGSEQEIIFENFLIPENANSDFYKLRVISSTVDNIISDLSEDFAIHYFEDNLRRISLNNNDDLILCEGGSFSETISITLEDFDGNVVDPDEYAWEWFKDGTLVLGESGSSLTISSVGRYYARLPFGLCNSSFEFEESNRVDVIIFSTDDVTISTDAADFSFCPNEDKTLIGSITDFSYQYQWYKDGALLEGFTTSTITLPDNDFGGDYELEVFFGGCSLKSTPPTTVTNEGSSILIPLPERLIKLPTQDNLLLEVTTDAPIGSPVVWRVGGSIQSSGALTEATSSFVANFFETYRVEISANDPCDSELFSETEVLAPTGFDLVIGTQDDVSCDQDIITLELLEMTGSTFEGFNVPLTEDQLPFFDFEWYNNGVATGETSLTLDINRTDVDGIYTLQATLRDNTEFVDLPSNPIPIVFLETDIVLDMNPEVLPVNGSVTLTAPFNADYSYIWFEVIDGENIIIEGETGNTLVVSEEGDYFAEITSSLCSTPTLITEVRLEAAVSGLIPNVITPGGNSANNDWVLPAIYNESDVEVTIYSANGKLDFEKSGGYSNDWPENSASNAQEMLYYYIIRKNNAFVRKGTITVIR